ARSSDQPHGDLQGMHAANGYEEALGLVILATRGGAVNARHVARDRLAQFRYAALIGIESLALGERKPRRFGDELRRRQVAFADPKRDQSLTMAPVVDHFDNPASADGLHLGMDGAEPVHVRSG